MIKGDADWIDLQFWVTRHERLELDGEGWVQLGVGARHDERNLGFRLLYPLKWTHRPEQGVFSPEATILFAEARPYSDAFIESLASVWRVKTPQRMAPMTAVAAYGTYGGDPSLVLAQEVDCLIVVGDPGVPAEADAQRPYGQMRLNLNLPAGTVTFHEREPDDARMRHAIVEAFARGS